MLSGMSPLTIQPARSYELNDIAELWADCGMVPSLRGFRNEMERKRISDPSLFLVARQDGEIVGAVMGGYDGRFSSVSRLAVSPEHRRQGIARALVDQLRVCLGELGASSDRLLVLDDNPDSRALWPALGWTRGPDVPTWQQPADA